MKSDLTDHTCAYIVAMIVGQRFMGKHALAQIVHIQHDTISMMNDRINMLSDRVTYLEQLLGRFEGESNEETSTGAILPISGAKSGKEGTRGNTHRNRLAISSRYGRGTGSRKRSTDPGSLPDSSG